MLHRSRIHLKVPRYLRASDRATLKDQLPPLRLTRRPPDLPHDVDKYLKPFCAMAELYEFVHVPTVASMSGGVDFDKDFCARAPEPLSLPRGCFFSFPGASDELDPKTWCANTRLMLDAVIEIKGFEAVSTDLSVATEMMLKNMHAPLIQWTVVEHGCVRFNVLPDLAAAEGDGVRSPRRAPRAYVASKESNYLRPFDAILSDDILAHARAIHRPLPAIEFVLGFGGSSRSVGSVHHAHDDRERRLARTAMGCSHSLLHERLHPAVWTVARALNNWAIVNLGTFAAASPSFWLSATSWFVAAGGELRSVSTENVDWAAEGADTADGRYALVAADAVEVFDFVHRAAKLEGPLAAEEAFDVDAMSGADMLNLLRRRSSSRQRRPNADHDAGKASDAFATVSRSSGNRKPHFVWHNFFLPAENLATLPSVKTFRAQLHEGGDQPTAQRPTPASVEASLFQVSPNHGRDVPEMYKRKLFIR